MDARGSMPMQKVVGSATLGVHAFEIQEVWGSTALVIKKAWGRVGCCVTVRAVWLWCGACCRMQPSMTGCSQTRTNDST